MSTTTTPRGAECRKFAPNIFNKSKCSSCFKQKEEHSAEALECNRATRKISKCGYLFVAPGWDFSNPLNRTKRWQRRWFVLYDDGELTYSVDEHPETVPQSRIDMTRVLEVAAAEDVTGHPYSLAVTSPDGVTFVKGTCREETRWWADVLQVYSRNKGRHKRNATFPGGQTTILQVTPTIRSNTPNPPRPRFNSCRSEPRGAWKPEANNEELNRRKFLGVTGSEKNSSNANDAPHANPSVNGNASDVNCENGNDVGRLTKAMHISLLRNSALLESSDSYVNSKNGLNGSLGTSDVLNSSLSSVAGSMLVGSEKPPMVPNDGCSYRDQPASSASPPTRDKLKAEDKARRRINHSNNQQPGDQTLSENDACRRILLEHEREREGKLRDIAASLTQPRIRKNKSRTSEPTRDVVDAANAAYQDKLIRGDPDGCGLDISGTRYSPMSELRVDLPSEDLLNIKKGWLMKQGLNNKEWNKHWFVLRGCGLMYYRDPSTEDKGIMDGVIDLNTVTAVSFVQVARNYGFQTVTWDDRGTTVLSAVTAGIRSGWMRAIIKAANLPDPENLTADDGGQISCENSQSASKPQSPTVMISDREAVPSTPMTPRSVLFSSDEEYRTASEGGRRESGDWSEIAVSPALSGCNRDWLLSVKGSNWSDSTSNHEWSELPPSPPLTRTALSRVKARSRSSSRSRVYKRSRSSPPNSRRSTLESVRSEDLMMACCELGEKEQETSNDSAKNEPAGPNENPLIVELLESQVNMLRDQLDQSQSQPLLVIVERQEHEIESLKAQISASRDEVTAAINEISRLRHEKLETNMRQEKMDELLGALAINEKQRKNDVEDYERVKKIFQGDKEILERKLAENENTLRENIDRSEFMNNELAASHRTIQLLRTEMEGLREKLSQGIDENERLYNRVRELEGKSALSASRERGRSFDSLSDLTNIDLELNLNGFDKERIMDEFDELRGRFEKAVLEIRAMRKELREAHTNHDALELAIFAHKQEASRISETNQAQTHLMAARIQDLTNKLAASEKQVRTLKQKIGKADTRDKRRSLSLKGRESFQISQEVEEKLNDLENKICAIERGKCRNAPISIVHSPKETSPTPKKERKRTERNIDRARLRRKSLDSTTSSEPMKVLIRLSTLETKVTQVGETLTSDAEKDSSECSETCSASEITHDMIARLNKLERALVKSKRRLEKCLVSTQPEEKVDKCLRDVNDILDSCLECKKYERASDEMLESVGTVVGKLESLLVDKMMELAAKRQRLVANDQLDERAKLELIAERLAYKTLLFRQLKHSIYGRCNTLNEFLETSQLISNFKSKLYENSPKIYQNTNCIQYLTRVLANKLVTVATAINDRDKVSRESSSIPRELDLLNLKERARSTNKIDLGILFGPKIDLRDYLATNQRQVNEMMQRYKDTKIRELADALAAETLSLTEQEHEYGKPISSTKTIREDRRIREAWAQAQETVNKELVQTEVSHVIMRCGQTYEEDITSIIDKSLNFTDDSSLEERIDRAQEKLRREMEFSIRELTLFYEKSLNRMKLKNKTPEVRSDPREMLNDYADIVAHKALIDVRISFLSEETDTKGYNDAQTSPVSSLIKHEDVLADLAGEYGYFDDHSTDAEFARLYRGYSNNCAEKIDSALKSKEEFRGVAQSLGYLEEGIASLWQSLGQREVENRVERSGQLVDWSDIGEKCADLCEQMRRLCDSAKNRTCDQCSSMQLTMKRMSLQHSEEIDDIRRSQEREIMNVKGEMDHERHSMSSQYEQEAASLRVRARKLEHRLNAIDSEHSAHVDELRSAYQRSISTELDTDAETRKRYKEEIKQLRGLCEKGLLAMENSHRRIIAETEEKHRQELENLRIEKEQALSEETQATLAALDAMRKAHEHEVQKEIAKFKAEFVKQIQAREDIGVLHKEHEEEMEEIKQEILSLSSKYSSKCVETAALEEKVGFLTKQIAQAQQHIMQLDARNKQLRAHLVIETNDSGVNDTIQLFRGRENEIAEQRQEIHRLQQQLKHGEKNRDISDTTKASAAPGYVSSASSNDATFARSVSGNTWSRSTARANCTLSTCQKPLSDDETPNTKFSYNLERLRSVSLPYAATCHVLPTTNAQTRLLKVRKEDNESAGLKSPLWDSLRPRTGLPHQYQGCSTPIRVRNPGIQWQKNEQSEKQQHQKALCSNSHYASRLTPEPSTLYVAELMRSPSLRWSGRSCRSLPATPISGYQNSLYPPLPAVGMVAERKKRFEL